MIGTAGPDVICGGAGSDTIFAGGGNDTICGGAGADEIHGEGGADVLLGQSGDDTLDGGAGSDFAQFESAVTADLSQGTANDGGDIVDTLISIENLAGSDGPDTLIGDKNNNVLDGKGGR